MKQNLQRSHSMTFRVTEKERELIRQRQEQTGIISLRAYLLKMAVDGRVIHVELESIREMNRLLSNIGNNINQIARRINTRGEVYSTDLREIITRQDEIWAGQKEILGKLNQLLEVAK